MPDFPVEFLIFALTLAGIALWHRWALVTALTGVCCAIGYQLSHGGVAGVPGIAGLTLHLQHEWVMLANLLALLTGFGLLAKHFEASRLPQWLPALLPDDWTGGFVLLICVFCVSAFLDNIAAAIIGGTVARAVFRGRVQIGYLAALVAAANAGGAGSVVGDTTTTMMWLSGVSPARVLHAFVPSLIALSVFGVLAARHQQAHAPITKDPEATVQLDHARLWVCLIILLSAIGTNVWVNVYQPNLAEQVPCIGLAVWVALLLTSLWRRPEWSALRGGLLSAAFLLSLVLLASLMPVTRLPEPTVLSGVGLGFVSAVFDNIPLTKLALEQGGYDWGLLAYAVGFGGSMVWFGSSAGVALCGQFPEARRVGVWLRQGWHVLVAYCVGAAFYIAVYN